MFIAAVVEDIGSGALVNGMTLSQPPPAKLRHISIRANSANDINKHIKIRTVMNMSII